MYVICNISFKHMSRCVYIIYIHIFYIYIYQSWALSVFLNFFTNEKGFFCIFDQVNLTAGLQVGGFLNRTGAEIDY